MTWLIPPLAGQKVTINPSLDNYDAHVKHHKATDGVIVRGVSITEWMLDGRIDESIYVVFPNGRDYSFNPKEIMPISGSFYEFTKYKIGSTTEHGLTKRSRYCVEKHILREGKSFVNIDVNKETRIEALKEAIAIYDAQNKAHYTDKKLEALNQRYASTLDELAVTKERDAQTFVEDESEEGAKKKTAPRRTFADAELF